MNRIQRFAAADVALSGQKPPEAFVDVASSTGAYKSVC